MHTMTATYSGDPNNALDNHNRHAPHYCQASPNQSLPSAGGVPGLTRPRLIDPAPAVLAAPAHDLRSDLQRNHKKVSANDPNTLLGTTVLNDV